jgi:hypothetical protein
MFAFLRTLADLIVAVNAAAAVANKETAEKSIDS